MSWRQPRCFAAPSANQSHASTPGNSESIASAAEGARRKRAVDKASASVARWEATLTAAYALALRPDAGENRWWYLPLASNRVAAPEEVAIARSRAGLWPLRGVHQGARQGSCPGVAVRMRAEAAQLPRSISTSFQPRARSRSATQSAT